MTFSIVVTRKRKSKLRNKYLTEKSEEARLLLYKRQRNICVFLTKKARVLPELRFT